MILCTGEAVIDMIRTQIDGHEAFLPIPGGCAYNTAIAIGRLDVPVAFFGRISSNFFGDLQVNRLRESNVNTGLILRCDQNPILAFIKIEEGKDPQYAFYEEGTADRLLSPHELPALSSDIKCIVFGSVSLAMEPIGSVIEEFILRESEQKVTAFDPNIRPVMIRNREAYLRRFEKLAGASSIIKISLEDFEYIQPDTQPQAALEYLVGLETLSEARSFKRTRLAVITTGEKGAMALLKRKDGSMINAEVNGIPVLKIADTVGAGDTFMGALLAHLDLKGLLSNNAIDSISEADFRASLEFANKAAAFVCTRHGCEPPSRKEIICS